jgi:hypothetical protein
MRFWAAAYWALGSVAFAAIWRTGWGPQATKSPELLLNLFSSALEIGMVAWLLRGTKFPLAGKLTALVLSGLATGFWANRASPSGPGVEVAHVLWLMLLVVVLAGMLGWDLFTRVLHRDRSAA